MGMDSTWWFRWCWWTMELVMHCHAPNTHIHPEQFSWKLVALTLTMCTSHLSATATVAQPSGMGWSINTSSLQRRAQSKMLVKCLQAQDKTSQHVCIGNLLLACSQFLLLSWADTHQVRKSQNGRRTDWTQQAVEQLIKMFIGEIK